MIASAAEYPAGMEPALLRSDLGITPPTLMPVADGVCTMVWFALRLCCGGNTSKGHINKELRITKY